MSDRLLKALSLSKGRLYMNGIYVGGVADAQPFDKLTTGSASLHISACGGD